MEGSYKNIFGVVSTDNFKGRHAALKPRGHIPA